MYNLSCTDFLSLTKLEFWRFCNSIDTVLTSCEGVLWKNEKEIKGSSATLNRLREIGKQIFFITNNSMTTRDEFVKRAQNFGFILHKNEVISTSYLAAYYLKSKNFSDTAYAIGSRGLAKELEAVGIKYIGPGPDPSGQDLQKLCDDAYLDPNVRAVVVGLDEHFSFMKLLKAASYLKNPECEFIAVNCEKRKSGSGPIIVPGAGAILTSIETCSGRKATILGKSGTFVADYLRKQYYVDSQRTLFIGNRLENDIPLGLNCGFQTLLILSEMTQKEMCKRKWLKCKKQEIEDQILPNLFTGALEDLLPYLTLTEYKI
ncbi:hypothetical protein WA026_014066 [Henosepilachna vigintioctopunctata]|uniref:Phosphoglycolate phosphatase n=1 Tax=Henosepilachna vigintioctopunctata TaxID=420089 RepID=A0AAW1TYL7_9CUCU